MIPPARLAESISQSPAGKRTLVAIAGAPGSGKTHLTKNLLDALNAEVPGRAAILPMDGYHYDDGVLKARGRLAFKGAPDTFDVGGLKHMIARLRDNSEAEVAAPLFDRDLEISRAGATIIPQSVEIVLIEGNYLLLKQEPWSELAPYFDMTVLVAVGEDELRRRLCKRWEDFGVAPDEIARKVDDNDLPNGHFVVANSIAPDVVVDGENR